MPGRQLTSRERKVCLTNFAESAGHMTAMASDDEIADITKLSFVEFCSYLGIKPTVGQQKLVALTFSRRITACPAAHGVGKSFVSAALILYAVIVKRALVISTAPTRRQVESIIWRSTNDMFANLKRNKAFARKFGLDLRKDFAIGQTFLRQLDAEAIAAGETQLWFEKLAFQDKVDAEAQGDMTLGYAFGFTSKANDTSSFQGLHSGPHGMVMIMDEATGISDTIHEAALSCATSSRDHILKIGNPTARGVAFHRTCVDEGCFPITAFDHPNVSPFYEKQPDGRYKLIDRSCLEDDYEDPMPGAVSPKWIEESISKYGEDSLFVRTRIYAKFPLLGQGTTTLISPNLAAIAVESREFDYSYLTSANLLVGLDVGDTGDSSVITVAQWIPTQQGRVGGFLCVRAIYEREPSNINDGLEQQRVYDWAVETIEGFRSGSFIRERCVYIQVDQTGLGTGIVKDLLMNTRYTVTGVSFASMADDNKAYTNIRADMYFAVSRLYEKGRISFFSTCDTTAIEEVHYQLSATSYEIELKNDRKKIIGKDLIQQIIGRSPDHADSLALCGRGLVISEVEY